MGAMGGASGGILQGATATTGAVLGEIMAGDQTDQAQKAYQDALNGILAVKVPTVEEQQITLQHMVQTGQLSPQMEETIQQNPSMMASIVTDPRYVQAQNEALSQMQGISQTGLNATDRMALGQIMRQGAGNANASSQSILANAAQRGQGGGGAALAAQLMAAQGASNNASQSAMQVGSQAQQRALQAMMQSGQMGSQYQQQQFGQKAQQAQAQDYINQFNAANKQNVAGKNTMAQNQAQQYNVQTAQNIANQNVGLQNQQEMHNKALYQQQFNNALNKAQAAAGGYQQQAGFDLGQAQDQRNLYNGIAGSVNQGISAYQNQPKESSSSPYGAYDSNGERSVDLNNSNFNTDSQGYGSTGGF